MKIIFRKKDFKKIILLKIKIYSFISGRIKMDVFLGFKNIIRKRSLVLYKKGEYFGICN